MLVFYTNSRRRKSLLNPKKPTFFDLYTQDDMIVMPPHLPCGHPLPRWGEGNKEEILKQVQDDNFILTTKDKKQKQRQKRLI